MYNVSKCPGCVFPSTPVCWQHRAAFSHWPQHVRAQQVNTVSTFLSLHLLVIPQSTPLFFLSTCTWHINEDKLIHFFLEESSSLLCVHLLSTAGWQSGSQGCSSNGWSSGAWQSAWWKGWTWEPFWTKARMWSASSPCSCSACNTWHHEQFY